MLKKKTVTKQKPGRKKGNPSKVFQIRHDAEVIDKAREKKKNLHGLGKKWLDKMAKG